MPGLTLNTQATAAAAAAVSTEAPITSSTPIPAPSIPPQQTRIPVPVPPMPYTSSSHEPPGQQQTPQRPASPARPGYSPITPPLNPTQLPPRPVYTHSSHGNATAAALPTPDPIDFDSNPDVLALKSAISILQIQRRKAERDIATLDRVRSAAVAQPEAFVRDLTSGRAGVEGWERTTLEGNEPNESDSSSDEEDAAREIPVDKDRPPPWTAIPKPQNIVRCPPINWSQYAVVGNSLDRLHDEQVKRPAQGIPATVTGDGQFEFRGGEGKQEPYVGVAAPYAPGKDKIDRKLKTVSK